MPTVYNPIEMKPLHILYLLAIHQNDFDSRIHRGHFADHAVFSQRVRELINMGLVAYDGRHKVTPLGAAHVEHLLSVPPTTGDVSIQYYERK